MTRKAIYKDTSLCVECHACRVACQMHNSLKPEQVYIKFLDVEEGRYPATTYSLARQSCHHCGKPACVEACPEKAIVMGKSGLTYYDVAKCVGCGACAAVCPYEVPEVVAGKAVRCTGCPDLVEANRPPACVETCIANALKFGDRAAMLADAEKRVPMLKKGFPDAALYGKENHGGLGLLQVLRIKSASFKLPA